MAAVDPATMQKLMHDIGGDAKVMRELVDTFLDEAPRLLLSMREALGAADVRMLNRVAHSLRSTSATFGANDLSRLCRDLEVATEKGWPPDAAARGQQVVEEWERVAAELVAWKPA